MRTLTLVAVLCAIAISALAAQTAQDESTLCCRPALQHFEFTPQTYDHVYPNDVSIEDVRRPDTRAFVTLQISLPGRANRNAGVSPQFLTEDGGRTWKRSGDMGSALAIAGAPILRAPSDSNILYRRDPDAGGLYLRSDDGGNTWVFPAFNINGKSKEEFSRSVAGSDEYHVVMQIAAVDPHSPNRIYAGVRIVMWSNSLKQVRPFTDHYLPGLYISSNGGQDWSLFAGAIRNFSVLGINPRNTDIMFSVAPTGVVKSVDGGKTWQPVGQQKSLNTPISYVGESSAAQTAREGFGKKELEIRQFLFDPDDVRVVYIVSNKGIFKTADGGESWCLLNLGLDEIDAVTSMALNPNTPSEIFVGSRHGLLESRDQGCHFSKVPLPRD